MSKLQYKLKLVDLHVRNNRLWLTFATPTSNDDSNSCTDSGSYSCTDSRSNYCTNVKDNLIRFACLFLATNHDAVRTGLTPDYAEIYCCNYIERLLIIDPPCVSPAGLPSDAPTDAPSGVPTASPSDAPTNLPGDAPTDDPTCVPKNNDGYDCIFLQASANFGPNFSPDLLSKLLPDCKSDSSTERFAYSSDLFPQEVLPKYHVMCEPAGVSPRQCPFSYLGFQIHV